ncbi:MAG: MFS transporter [Verrucomicrobia bacterium]|nr:MFS transporter [Verrucomicrobiota bacterium]
MNKASEEPMTEKAKIRRLPWALATDAAYSYDASFTVQSPVFMLFLDALKFPMASIGMLVSLIPFCGLLSPLVGLHVERLGVKRIFVTFWSLRYLILSGLLVIPWIQNRFGGGIALQFLMVILIGFAICRTIAETALTPWMQEYIPERVRGRYFGISGVISTVFNVASVWTAGYLLNRSSSMSGYLVVFGIGVIVGVASALFSIMVPCGKPKPGKTSLLPDFQDFHTPLKDRNFRYYLIGRGFVLLAQMVVGTFLPLYFKDKLGLSTAQVIQLQVWVIIGRFASLPLGWLADRIGGKSVMLIGQAAIMVMSLAWVVIPHQQGTTTYIVTAAALLLNGIAGMAYALGDQRMFYGSVLPAGRNMNYIMVFYPVCQVISGAGNLFSGFLLDGLKGFQSNIGSVHLDQFAPLFILGTLLAGVGALILAFVRKDPPSIKSEKTISSPDLELKLGSEAKSSGA